MYDSINQKQCTVALFLDLSKAYDTVDVDILLRKLNHYGFRGNVNDFLRNYFVNRKQYVQANDFNSNHRDVEVGLTQGSLNSPTIFNIFINDLCNFSTLHGFNSTLFADDAVFYCSGTSVDETISKLNDFVILLSDWLTLNKLTPNLLKTKLMLFSNQKQVVLPLLYFNEWVDWSGLIILNI